MHERKKVDVRLLGGPQTPTGVFLSYVRGCLRVFCRTLPS